MSSGARAVSWRRLWRWGRAVLGLALLAGAVLFVVVVAQRARLEAPPPTLFLLDRHGAFLSQIGHATSVAPHGRRLDYGYWPLASVPERVMQATLALEDRRFWRHPGVDVLALLRACWQNLRGAQRSGASTIAMQVARMQRPAPRTLWHKALEAGTGLALTWRYGRQAVLAHYLRLVPYGNGSHGLAHAARWYLDKPVEDVSWAELALLAAIPQSPTRLNPRHRAGLERAVRRAQRLLNALAQQGVITATELALAQRQLQDMPLLSPPRRPEALHALLYYETLARQGALQPAVATDPRLRSSLDLRLQQQVTVLARRHLDAWRDAGAQQVAVLVVARGSAEVLASVGSSGYHERLAGAIDFSRVPRSPGSALKPFVYALALERGLLNVSDVLADLPDGAAGIGNADGQFLGPLLPRQALANSRNVPATNLLRRLGLESASHFLHTLGLHDLETPASRFGLAMAIGTLPTTLQRLARAYTALSEDGRLLELRWYEGQRQRAPVRVLSVDTARLLTSFLADPLARLPSFARYGPLEYPFPVAVKTGTSQGYRDAWAVAWSARYLVAAWLGRADHGTMTQVSGVRSAARLAQAIMLQAHGALPGELADTDFPPPPGRVAAELCVLSGQRHAGDCTQSLREWLTPDERPLSMESVALQAAAVHGRTPLTLPARHRTWARGAGYRLDDVPAGEVPIRLAIVAPEHNSRLWRNPEAPPGLQRLVLKVVAEPHVPQVVWYVNGEPFAVTDPDTPVSWPLQSGTHRFQVRLPLRAGASRPVRIVVE
ncbi:MAG: transglycosylase domain-containing protein [Candidatus Tectimicrobiota bacterium]